MAEAEMKLTFRSDIVWPWGLFFSEIAEFMSGELPALKKARIDLVLGDFLTPPSVSRKEADVGFVTPPACITMAFKGVGPYREKMENLRAIGVLPHDDMPEDVIFLMTKLFVEKRVRLFEFHFRDIPAEACNLAYPIDPHTVWKNVGGIPLHKGAERYYRESGYLVP